MDFPSIYELVREEMLQVEESIKAITRVDPPKMTALLEYILRDSGKRIRPAITLLAGGFYRYNPYLLVPMATAVELLHTATLLHDDALEDSGMRRGKPTVNQLWGRSTAVLAGDYLFAQSAQFVARTGDLRVITLFAHTVSAMCSGELEQDIIAYDWHQSREEYLERIGNKTASLFAAAAQSGALLSRARAGTVTALGSYGYNLGMAFQIVDDILDYIGEEEEMGKPVASDLLQGTLTLPAILLIERYPKDNPIKSIFAKRKRQENLKRAIEMIQNSPIIGECYAIAQGFSAQASQALEQLPDKPCRRSLLTLLEYALQRKK